MTSTGYGAMPLARMWLSAKCFLQIGAPGHFTSAGVRTPLSTKHSAQHVSDLLKSFDPRSEAAGAAGATAFPAAPNAP
jgi:hypothetical protein